MAKVKAGTAMLKVLESWGVKNIYGIPGGSFNSVMYGLRDMQDSIKYVQVRHEETGALAASAHAKLTGWVGVCFGSAGPGATHLFNGLYDANMDHAPVVALIGQVASTAMNYTAFQELNENPMFTDVSVYNRTVMTPESLPHVVDEAVKHALEYKSVAVVTLPVDFGNAEIEDAPVSSADAFRSGVPVPDERDITGALALIGKAAKPILYIGRGLEGGREAIEQFSEHFSMPVVASVMAKGIVPDDYPNYMGQSGRVATKPGVEATVGADLIVFAGSDFPFAKYFFAEDAKFIHINTDLTTFGRRHRVDAPVYGDAAAALRMMTAAGKPRPADGWLAANRTNKANWVKWMWSFGGSGDVPMRPEPVFREINRIAADDAVFIADVGNVTIDAVRFLDMNGRQKFTTSGWFATMGYGVPGGIAAALDDPRRQVITLSGDGGFAMAMQDILTQVKYGLPVINVVFSNDSLGFIEAEQENDGAEKFGILLQEADFGRAAEAMGAVGFTVSDPARLPEVFDAAAEAAATGAKPVVIDVKIANERPLPVENLILDPDRFAAQDIERFKTKYRVHGMPTLGELLKS